jgi:hypothetical protein
MGNQGSEVLVQGLQNGDLPRTLTVLDTCTKVHNNQAVIRVINTSQEDVWLQPRQQLGLARLVDVVEQPSVMVEANAHAIYVYSAGEQTKTDDIEWLHQLDINTEELSADEIATFMDLMKKFGDVFSVSDDDIGYTTTVTHKIRLTDEVPIKMAPRRVPPHQVQEVKDHLQNYYCNKGSSDQVPVHTVLLLFWLGNQMVPFTCVLTPEL